MRNLSFSLAHFFSLWQPQGFHDRVGYFSFFFVSLWLFSRTGVVDFNEVTRAGRVLSFSGSGSSIPYPSMGFECFSTKFQQKDQRFCVGQQKRVMVMGVLSSFPVVLGLTDNPSFSRNSR